VGLTGFFHFFRFFQRHGSLWLADSDRERNRCMEKKEKKKRNNYKPHICRGFRFKLSSLPRVKEGIRK